MTEPLLASSYRFRVAFTRPGADQVVVSGGFQECTGLELEMDVTEYAEGGRNDGLVQRPGRVKYPRLVLRRGMTHPPDGRVDSLMWDWLADAVAGVRPVRRYDVTVELHGAEQSVVGRWRCLRGVPAKVVGPQLNARTGEVAIEEIQIAHEGLRLVTA